MIISFVAINNVSSINVWQSGIRASSDQQPKWQHEHRASQNSGQSSSWICNTHLGWKLSEREQPKQKRKNKKEKNEDPDRFENSQKGGDLGKRANIK